MRRVATLETARRRPGTLRGLAFRHRYETGRYSLLPARRLRLFSEAGMSGIPIHQLIPVLQMAIGPVILISGIGLLLLTLSNRFGRAVDRSRLLGREMRDAPEQQKRKLAGQVSVLYWRAAPIRLSITMAAMSVLLAAVMIIVLFRSALLQLEAGGIVVTALFVACLGALIISLIAFMREIQLSLSALKVELSFQDLV